MALPPGSLYRGSVNPAERWSEERYRLADIIDALHFINWRLMGCPSRYTPEPAERPGDRERQELARRRAREVRKRIESTRWKEA